MIRAYTLPPVRFSFRGDQTRTDKLRGLQELGPYQQLPITRPLRFGFVFPRESRDHANSLYLALRNGIGYFKGVERVFRLSLNKDSVFPITGFSVRPGQRSSETAHAYTDAILTWNAKNTREQPDLFFVIHPKTQRFETGTAYYECKALLLQEGILSQSVTQELINNRSQFDWSAANIALGAFAKLGGVPWVVAGDESESDLIIGVGRSNTFDPVTRQNTQYIGFTACFSARGAFKFVSFAEIARSHEEYLKRLTAVVETSLEKAERIGKHVTSLTVHVPSEMGRAESDAIRDAAQKYSRSQSIGVLLAKVSDESNFMAVDEQFSDGVPRRGTVIQVTDRDYVLYTEGREEKEQWKTRAPGAVRVTPQRSVLSRLQASKLLRQVNDLSQVNWRGFNARSKPISLAYGQQIAQILSHVSPATVHSLYQDKARALLEERMWFL